MFHQMTSVLVKYPRSRQFALANLITHFPNVFPRLLNALVFEKETIEQNAIPAKLHGHEM